MLNLVANNPLLCFIVGSKLGFCIDADSEINWPSQGSLPSNFRRSGCSFNWRSWISADTTACNVSTFLTIIFSAHTLSFLTRFVPQVPHELGFVFEFLVLQIFLSYM